MSIPHNVAEVPSITTAVVMQVLLCKSETFINWREPVLALDRLQDCSVVFARLSGSFLRTPTSSAWVLTSEKNCIDNWSIPEGQVTRIVSNILAGELVARRGGGS